MYRIIAMNKERTEGYAEIIESVHPIGKNRAFVLPVSGIGYFCNVVELIDIDEADIIHHCAGGCVVKVRLKGDVQE